MARLFVAVDLPSVAKTALVAIQPANASGVRLVALSQVHITLHFIGAAEVDRMANALAGLASPAFTLSIEGVGQFRSASGNVTLWAGISDSPGLLRLHADVGAALEVAGFQPETRPYTPHITLARCKLDAADSVADDFLSRHADFALASVPISAFGLYSSEFVGGAPVYRCEKAFPLVAGHGGSA
jgi:2'-5' RNA ligase